MASSEVAVDALSVAAPVLGRRRSSKNHRALMARSHVSVPQRSELGSRRTIAHDLLACECLPHEYDRVHGRCVYRAGMVDLGINVLLDSSAVRAGVCTQVQLNLWRHISVSTAGPQEHWSFDRKSREAHEFNGLVEHGRRVLFEGQVVRQLGIYSLAGDLP